MSIIVGFAPSAEAATFRDVPMSSPYRAAVDALSQAGVIGGYPDGTFRPDQSVNRAEALKILLLGAGVDVTAPSTDVFPDVVASAWYAPYIATAKSRGIVGGYPDGRFRPEQTVSLVESLKMVTLTSGIDLTNFGTTTRLFADTAADAWYNPYLAYADVMDLIDPDASNRITPATPLTRGRLVELMYRFRLRDERVCAPRLAAGRIAEPTYFQYLTLDRGLPTTLFENDVLTVRGRVTNLTEKKATVFFISQTAGQRSVTRDTAADGTFAIPLTLRLPGSYQISVLPGVSGRSYALPVEVLPRECAPTTADRDTIPVSTITTDIIDNDAVIRWSAGESNLARVFIRQGTRSVERTVLGGETSFVPTPSDFIGWAAGPATITIFAARSESGASYEPRTRWTGPTTATITLAQHHFSDIRPEALTLAAPPPSTHTGAANVTLRGTAVVDLESDAYLTRPDGGVSTIRFATSDIVPAGSAITVDFPLTQAGTYFLEINDTTGLAAVNHPVYQAGTVPLVPDFQDLKTRTTKTTAVDVARERQTWLALVNALRTAQKLRPVVLDGELTTFAQDYADTMARGDFFGHEDPAGNGPDERRQLAGIALPVGENLARDRSTASAHAGLARSGAHLANMLDPAWTRVGLGIAVDPEGNWLFVQEFSSDPLTAATLPARRAELLTALNLARGGTALTLDTTLADAAQDWSELMRDEDFFAFEGAGTSLESRIRAAGFRGAFSTFIASAGSLKDAAASVVRDGSLSGRTRVAIGLAQGSDGAYLATFIFR